MKLVAAVLVPALFLHSAVGLQQPAAPTAQYTYQGTVRTVQPAAGSLALVTGVGLALRLVPMQVAPATRIEAAGTRIALGDLRAGDIVRAECHRTEAGLVADRIEKLGRAQ